MASPTQPETIDLSSLPAQTLSSLKSQLDADLTHLTTSHSTLRTAQQKFRDCITSLASISPQDGNPSDIPILVPLTTSLYVPGVLADREKVLVDVGTGFFVEKTPTTATNFYNAKVEELGRNLKELEGAVGQKTGNLRVVEEVLRQKVLVNNNNNNNNNSEGAAQTA